MRVALFSWESNHSVHVGGVALHVTELACALERRGQEVHVFTRMGRPDDARYECIHGVHYHRCPFDANPDFVEEINNMCRSFVQAYFATEDHIGDFDIVHAHDWLAANAMAWIKEGRGTRAVLTLHSTEYGRSGNNFFGGTSERVRSIERFCAHAADTVITVSKALKGEVVWMYDLPDEKVNVVYNGIACHDFDGWVDPAAVRRQYAIGPLDPVALFVGRMVNQKGPDLLVSAIPHVLKFYNNAKFIFAGDGEQRMAVEDQARSMGVAHATRFLGHVRGWRLADLYKSSDCVVVPSRNEPFGLVVLEAWSAGKPVVATKRGGPAEIVWHDVNGYQIDPNPDSIAWGIGTLFADFDHGRWMGRNGRVAAESVFSWDMIADQTLAVYCN